MTTSDYNLGTSSIVVETKRFIPRLDWSRDRGTKEESLIGFVEEIQRDATTDEVLSRTTYMVKLSDQSLNDCRGHNVFLSDVKDTLNTVVREFKQGTPVDISTGSVNILI